MSYRHALVLYQTVTPLHVGCGQDVGVVDLPVIRERTTGYPFVPGSGIRGSLRDLCERRDQAAGSHLALTLFGPRPEDEEVLRHAGSVAVHDAKVLLFPVRSDEGTFAWLTCPAILDRFARDLGVFLGDRSPQGWVEVPRHDPGDEAVLLSTAGAGTICLEEFSFERLADETEAGSPRPIATARRALTAWAARIAAALAVPRLAGAAVVVSDRTFFHFAQHATIVLQHNRLTSAKTVAGGALFSIEAVPPETVLYGFLGATESRRANAIAAGEARDGAGSAGTAAAAGAAKIAGGPAPETAQPSPPPADPTTAAEVLGALRALWADGPESAEEPPPRVLHLGGDEGTGLGVTRLLWVAAGEER